ncbi:MAG: hypothetical protein B6I26_08395 [Desulfobacteraceae bacterium 4572_130]|nr:MAG: hypothetical protein B6I26_08395 [Desulfobacteraceae bacterium 4572_130]
METIAIPKFEYNNLLGLKNEIENIKKNYISRNEMDEILETIEILSDKKLMNSIKQSNREIKEGKTKILNDFEDLINELE